VGKEGPTAPEGGWLPLEFPEYFALESFDRESGEWLLWATYGRDQVYELGDNHYVAASAGMPIHFRCVERNGNEVESVAGTGERIRYRLIPIQRKPEEAN
jgi:hypothetical protein